MAPKLYWCMLVSLCAAHVYVKDCQEKQCGQGTEENEENTLLQKVPPRTKNNGRQAAEDLVATGVPSSDKDLIFMEDEHKSAGVRCVDDSDFPGPYCADTRSSKCNHVKQRCCGFRPDIIAINCDQCNSCDDIKLQNDGGGDSTPQNFGPLSQYCVDDSVMPHCADFRSNICQRVKPASNPTEIRNNIFAINCDRCKSCDVGVGPQIPEGCEWEERANSYSGGYAAGLSTKYSNIAQAKGACIILGKACKAITCKGETCTMRKSEETKDSAGETTYLPNEKCLNYNPPPTNEECWEERANSYSGGYPDGISTIYSTIGQAKGACISLGSACKAITCKGETCTMRKSEETKKSDGETTYMKKSCA